MTCILRPTHPTDVDGVSGHENGVLFLPRYSVLYT